MRDKILLAIAALISCLTLLMVSPSIQATTGSKMNADNNQMQSQSQAQAVFAGGCFWCMQGPMDKLPGVVKTEAGYATANHKSIKDPTYKQVASGETNYVEAVAVYYDPKKINYHKLLDVYWKNIDPLSHNGQFCDRGKQYRSVIYVQNEQERKLAERDVKRLHKRFKKTIHTEVAELVAFYPAEAYHQQYYKKNPFRYKLYRTYCGRDKRLEKLWGE